MSANASTLGSHNKTHRDWTMVFGGAVVFLVGLVIFFWPGLTLVSIALMAGVMLLMGGVFDIVSYFRLKNTGLTSGWAIVNGILSLILGAMFIIHPIVSASVIPMLAGFFVLFYGGMAIASAFAMRKANENWGIMLLNGLVSLFCGFMFVFLPGTFAIYLAIFLMMRGMMLGYFGFTTTTD